MIGRSVRTSRAGARRKRIAQGTALTVLAGVLVVLAVRHDGTPIHDVELNDGGVWVTNSSLGMMARLNSQVKELELGVSTTSTSTKVFQEAGSVQVYDDGGGGSDDGWALHDSVGEKKPGRPASGGPESCVLAVQQDVVDPHRPQVARDDELREVPAVQEPRER